MPQFVTDDAIRLNYRVHGTGPTPVIFVHGWASGAASWDPLIAALDLKGLKLFVLDLRGAGDSASADLGFTLERFAADVRGLAEAEKLERYSLVGHSMGGLVAQLLAAEHPLKVVSLVTVCSVPARKQPMPPQMAALFRDAAGKRESFEAILALACKKLSEGAREKLVALSLLQSSAAIAGGFEAFSTADFEPLLWQVRAPTLVLATDDPFLGHELQRAQITQKIAGARQAYLPGVGHYPQLESPAESAAILQAFWAGALR